MHPSLFGRDAELAAAVTTPVALVAAKGDPLEAVRDAVVAKGGALAAKSVWLRFDDMEVCCCCCADWVGKLRCWTGEACSMD